METEVLTQEFFLEPLLKNHGFYSEWPKTSISFGTPAMLADPSLLSETGQL